MAHLEEGWFESPEGTSTPRLEPPRVYRPAEADEPLDGPDDAFEFEVAGGGALLGNTLTEAGEEPASEPPGPARRWSRMDSAADLEAWLQERRAERAASRQREAAALPPPAEAEPPEADAADAHLHPLAPAEGPDLESTDWLAEVPVEEGAVDDPAWNEPDEAAAADWREADEGARSAGADDAPAEAWDDALEGEPDPAWADGPGEGAAAAAPSDEPAWADAPFEGAAGPAWSEAAPEAPAPHAGEDAAWEADDEAPEHEVSDGDDEDEEDDEGEEGEEGDGRVVRARPASYGAHALAWTVDGLLVVGLATTLLWLAGRVVGAPASLSSVASAPTTVVAALLVAAVMGVFYTAGFTVGGGQTLGGRLAGVTVLDGSGFPPSLGRAFLRAVLAVPGILILGVGLAWVVFDEHGQSLHDRISRTWAVEIE